MGACVPVCVCVCACTHNYGAIKKKIPYRFVVVFYVYSTIYATPEKFKTVIFFVHEENELKRVYGISTANKRTHEQCAGRQKSQLPKQFAMYVCGDRKNCYA